MQRSSGILMPIFSLPSNYGIGTLGKEAYKFIDFLKKAGQKYWQILPIGPTDHGDSPYSSPSSFAGNPYFIDLDMLIEEGLLKKGDVTGFDWGDNPNKVSYGCMYENRMSVLKLAYNNSKGKFEDELNQFEAENAIWLDNYAMYMALKIHFDMSPWTDWPDDIRKREPSALERYKKELEDTISFYKFTQYIFFRQWSALKDYAVKNGISFIGDIPIYVAMDSADVWSEPQFFLLDENCVPKEVSGVPPDAFSAEGQLWGNPLYDYDAMKADGFGWWIRRIDGARRMYNVLRIDHFRGLASYWAVPYGEKTAKNGRWIKGPGMDLVGVLTSWFPDITFIAEDLGILSDDVRQLLEASGLPGMKVLEFAFDSTSESSYLPHNCTYNSVCYIGTHDNDTAAGWAEAMKNKDKKFAESYMHITEDEGWPYGLIRTGMATASKLFVVQMQDLLELPGEDRTNIPGVATGNWRWRMTKYPDYKKLLEMTKIYRRL